jgi:DNA-binding transcriptional LysR family regulator
MDIIESIKIFKRVAETKSFSTTAQNLRLSQPTISKSIRSLENYLEVTLLRRSTRGVHVTAEGERLLFASNSLLDQLDSVLAAVKNENVRLSGQLRIACSLAIARILLTPLLEPFEELHPDVRFQFLVGDGYIDPVQNNLDLCIWVGAAPDSSLKAIQIGSVRRRLYAAPAYVKRFGLPESLSTIDSHRLLHYTRLTDPPCWPVSCAEGIKMHHFDPYFQTDSSDVLRAATLAGAGIALLPTWMAEPSNPGESLVKVLPNVVYSYAPIFAVTSHSKQLSGRQRAFLEFLKEKFTENSELSIISAEQGIS